MTAGGKGTEDGAMEPTAAANPSPSSPSVMHRLSLATMGLARPLAGRRIFPLWAVLEHRGRSTGTVRRTPVVALRAAGGFIIPMRDGAAEARVEGRFEDAAGHLGPMRPIARRAGIETYLRVQDA